MWLVPRHSNGLHRRTPLPSVVREALIRWYVGEGSEADHRASVILVVKARTHHQWLACDCLGEAPPPLLSPAFLSEAETYYLRRLTSRLQQRPEHRIECPFYRPQAPQRFREKGSAMPQQVAPDDGFFLAHRPAPEKLSQLPHEADTDDRSRGVAIPRLARLLWRLMDLAQVNVLQPLPQGQGSAHCMADEFRRLRKASESLELAPGVPLARHFYTHVEPFNRHQVFARLREDAPSWPVGFAPQAFLLLYALHVSGTRLALAQGQELELKNRVQHIGVHAQGIGGPFLVLVLVGETNPREGYVALRGYTQPIHGPNLFVPVSSATERAVVDALMRLQYRLRRRMVGMTAKKPLFDVPTLAGPVRPDFVLNFNDHRTGELAEAAVLVHSSDEPEHLAFKDHQRQNLSQLGPVIVVDQGSLRAGALERAIAERLDLQL